MKMVSTMALAVSVALASAAYAAEVSVVTNVGGPEGPLVVDGTLYFVGWTADGGAYATIFGPYVGPVPTRVSGRILYLAPGGDR